MKKAPVKDRGRRTSTGERIGATDGGERKNKTCVGGRETKNEGVREREKGEKKI